MANIPSGDLLIELLRNRFRTSKFFMRLAADILRDAFKRVDKYLEETNITREELLLLSEAERKLRFKNYINNASVAPDNFNQIIVKQVALVN